MSVFHEHDGVQHQSNGAESANFGQRTPEPVAVIGMGCRFAGDANSPEEYWRLLMEGRDGIGEVPPERWESYAEASPQNAATLRKVTRNGGFLDDIEGFDADFFGILPREAELMDPQQRIVLEVAWEALEHAGIRPRSLAGGDAGVFIGVGSDDYGRRMLEDLPRIEAWTGIGAAFCAVANRISYTLDLRGSSLAVDTACSASLVALHLACQALRSGECPVALAGGVNIMAGPGLTMVLDAAGAVSPDGRSKSFDASADGYGRGEGAGVVVLKRLSDAQRDGDRVLAVIRGSAVNQDGRTNGIMAPSEEAQAHLLRQAYRSCGIDPATIDYVEAHGTGTRAGDPIEVGAMAQVFGPRPADRPCLVGSVKPNVGHLEAGAGVAGLIKAVLALHHGEIPPQADYFTTPNPAIRWDEAGLKVVTEPTPWPVSGHPRRAGVSGYGYGGTISHLILEEAPAPTRGQQTESQTGPLLLPLSAATEAGVCSQAGRLAEWLTGTGAEAPLADVAATLSGHRDHLQSRAAVVAADRKQAVERLTALAEQRLGDGVETGAVLPAAGDAVWVFSGHGAQWIGMGREFLEREPVFSAVLDEIEPVFLEEIGFSPRQVLLDGDLVDVDRIQPMIFAMQVALSAVWRSRGLRPSAVIGHSVGELAAAVEAGILSLLDGSRLICRRSVLLRRVAGRGAMVMVGLPFDEVAARLAGRADVSAAIAASPGSTVAAGGVEAVAAVAAEWEAQGLTVRRVASDVAFHSAHMDPRTGPGAGHRHVRGPGGGPYLAGSRRLGRPRFGEPACAAGRGVGTAGRSGPRPRPGIGLHPSAGVRHGRGPAQLHPADRPPVRREHHTGPTDLRGRRGPDRRRGRPARRGGGDRGAADARPLHTARLPPCAGSQHPGLHPGRLVPLRRSGAPPPQRQPGGRGADQGPDQPRRREDRDRRGGRTRPRGARGRRRRRRRATPPRTGRMPGSVRGARARRGTDARAHPSALPRTWGRGFQVPGRATAFAGPATDGSRQGRPQAVAGPLRSHAGPRSDPSRTHRLTDRADLSIAKGVDP